MKNLFHILGIAVAMTVVGCSSSYYAPVRYMVYPVTENIVWSIGQPLAKSSADSVSVRVGFNKQQDEYFVFDVDLTNMGSNSFLISPEKFFFTVDSPPRLDSNATILQNVPTFAIDPEQKLQAIDWQLDSEESDYKSFQAANATKDVGGAVLGVLGFANDLLHLGKKKTQAEQEAEEKERKERDERDERERNERQYRELLHQNRLLTLNSERRDWETTSLRRTTLEKLQALHGKLYIPINPSAAVFTLVVPIGDSKTSFRFNQVKISK